MQGVAGSALAKGREGKGREARNSLKNANEFIDS